jgi:hypothetical protein
LDFLGEVASFVSFPNGYCPFFGAPGPKKWRADERPTKSQKNENTTFSSGNQNAKLGFETEKHLFVPNYSCANSDETKGVRCMAPGVGSRFEALGFSVQNLVVCEFRVLE